MAKGNDERDNPHRRPTRPWEGMTHSSHLNSPSTSNPEFPQGGLGKALADMIKQAVYDAEFNNIVGIPNDIVGEPKDDK
jgi:protein required for attachment to host cells